MNEKINKHFNSLFTLFVISITTLFYVFLLLNIDRGTSCDEGYYLLSYLQGQNIGWGISQFAFIVKSFLGFLPEDNALILRYIRFTINIVVLLLFAFSSYKWIKNKFNPNLSLYFYTSLIFLSGILSFGFASPILYYDNIQLFVYLLVFSFYFINYSSTSSFTKTAMLVLAGFVMVFGVFNYLPSGLLLIFSIIFLLLLDKNSLKTYLFLLLGFILGIVFYHFLVKDLGSTVEIILSSFQTAQVGTTRHDNASLIISVLKYLFEFSLIFIFFMLVGFMLAYVEKINSKNLKYGAYILFLLVILALCTQKWLFAKFYSSLLVVPVAILVGYFLLNGRTQTRKFSNLNVFVLLILLFTPLMGIFGTNQSLAIKLIIFMPFWVVLYFSLISILDLKNNTILVRVSHISYTLLLIAGFAYFVYFHRAHYYYTPKKSNVKIENTVRFQNIKVSSWQKDFNEKAIQLLSKNGFQKGDEVLAFYDNFITVYMAGGYIPNNLIYQFEVFASDKKNIPEKPVKYLLIIEEQEKPMQEFLKDTNWEFPDSYMRFDLGKAAENLPAEGYHSILYVKK